MLCKMIVLEFYLSRCVNDGSNLNVAKRILEEVKFLQVPPNIHFPTIFFAVFQYQTPSPHSSGSRPCPQCWGGGQQPTQAVRPGRRHVQGLRCQAVLLLGRRGSGQGGHPSIPRAARLPPPAAPAEGLPRGAAPGGPGRRPPRTHRGCHQ